jgi:hypothetical protein
VADEEGQRSAHAIYARLTPDGVEFAAVTPEYLARLEAVAAAADKATSEILHMDPYPFLGRDGPGRLQRPSLCAGQAGPLQARITRLAAWVQALDMLR